MRVKGNKVDLHGATVEVLRCSRAPKYRLLAPV